MDTKILRAEDVNRVRVSELAKKHTCSKSYVRQVLKGQRRDKTMLAKAILRDAEDILKILDRDTYRIIST